MRTGPSAFSAVFSEGSSTVFSGVVLPRRPVGADVRAQRLRSTIWARKTIARTTRMMRRIFMGGSLSSGSCTPSR